LIGDTAVGASADEEAELGLHGHLAVEYDREAYRRRDLIERCVNRLKQFRRIATRYEKTARAFISMSCIAATRALD
jgi:transposase